MNNRKILFNGCYFDLFDDGEIGVCDGVGFIGSVEKEEAKRLYMALKILFNESKQPYEVRYKLLPNDRDIDDMKPLKVWATSPLAACQTLVDANDWRGQSMEFVVTRDDVNYHYMSHDLE